MDKRLIINADDFGWDTFATEGILDLAKRQAISSTTVLATHVCAEDLKELLKIKNVSAGFHLNLIDGNPVSRPSLVKSLTDSNGQFFPAPIFYKKFLLNTLNKTEVKTEVLNQIKRLKYLGLDISHADSHQHIHQYPILGDFILRILEEAGIRKIRKLNTNRFSDKRRMILKAMSLYPQRKTRNFISPEILLSDFSAERKANLSVFIKSISAAFKKYKTAEMMTHPGITDKPGSYLKRKEEYEFLKSCEWKSFLEKNAIKLISFRELY
jgi:predicted glycoside hydrolase/deacetylase ChbG (UPF0249 family)